MCSRRSFLRGLAALAWQPAFDVRAADTLVREQRRLFGSVCELALLEPPGRDGTAADAWNELVQIDARWNAWKPGEVSALNAAFRGGRPALVSPALCSLVRGAQVLEVASLGLFNAGLGGLVGAWGFHADVLRDGPAPGAAVQARWRDAAPSLSQIHADGDRLVSSNPMLQLDFGAYAKGVAVDRVLDRLAAQGVQAALLNLGGNLAVMGRPGERDWHIGIRDPFGDGLVASLLTQGREAVVTSGSYERHRMADGRRVTHIFDPRRGQPANGLVSVTVVHRGAGVADAAATALLVAGPGSWRPVARRMGLDQVMLIDADGCVQVTPALQRRLDFEHHRRPWRVREA